ncbi:MAG: ATP-binding protein [Patescibacteria group bacterium]|nr:hypothetical protein [Patescibacteria group bacterium]MBU2508908.1 hypothetical protein [Patescibacteria group bacterium]
MPLLPFELSITVGIAFVVFMLGLVTWLHNRGEKANVVFALSAFILSFWTLTSWLQSLEATAQPIQITTWRLIFYSSIALAPALAIHAASILEHRVFRLKGSLTYVFGFFLFILFDSAFVLKTSDSLSVLGHQFYNLSLLLLVLFYTGAVFVVATQLMPIFYSHTATLMERRRIAYGTLLVTLFLIAGVYQLAVGPIVSSSVLTLVGGLFFLIASVGFVRVRLFDLDFSAVEAFFLVLISAAMVLILRSQTLYEAFTTLAGAIVVVGFGTMAIKTINKECGRRRKAEQKNKELEELEKLKTDLIAITAHQIRGPIGGIRFAVDMLSRGDYGRLPEQAKKITGLIRNSMDRLLALSETSLNAARVQSGDFQIVISEVDVAAELKMLLAEVLAFAKSKGINLEYSFKDLPPSLKLDREVLRNVVFNLIDNAIKYTDTGSVKVKGRKKGERLIIEVSDTGAGLSEKDQERLFDRFHRGSDCASGHRGAGLGLYVAKNLVNAAGGEISVQSEGKGKGSRFVVEFPL